MQPNTPITPPNESPKKLPTLKMIIAITALILFGRGYCFAQSNEKGQIMNTNIKQEERIAALEKRIAAVGDDFVSLTAEDYDLLLSQPIGTVNGFEPRTTATGGILVGVGLAGNGLQKAIQTLFQNFSLFDLKNH